MDAVRMLGKCTMPRRCKAFRSRGDEPRGVEPRGGEQVARGSSEGVSIVGGSMSRFGALFWTLFWLVIGLRSTLEHRSPGSLRGHYGVMMGSLWIRDGEKDRFECRNRLSGTHRGGSGNLLSFFDPVTKLVTAPVHIILTDGYLVG
jgi:hypothetical protein